MAERPSSPSHERKATALAYSTASQLGEMFVAVGHDAGYAAMFHLTTHALFKSALFMSLGVVDHQAGSRDIRQLSGLARTTLRNQLSALYARLGVKNRENMRFARTRIFGLVRELVRALGGRLVDAGALERTDDVFYLTLDEIFDFIKGTAVTTHLRELTALRRAEFDQYRGEDPPDDRFETRGPVRAVLLDGSTDIEARAVLGGGGVAGLGQGHAGSR